MAIKNIILDLGGVLLPINYNAPVIEFEKLGIGDFKLLFSQAKQSTLFDDFEMGKIDANDFRNWINEISKLKLSDSEINNAWNSILLDFPAERKIVLEKLSKKYKLFLLSNTNEIHISSFEKSIQNKFGYNFFNDVFAKVYYSSRVGMRKPDKAIFDFVLNENKLNPSETVFIDDSIQHVHGANKSGIQAHWLDTTITTTEVLLENLKLI